MQTDARHRVVRRTDWPTLTLTFDDGPDDEYTPQILAILHHYSVSATFFCLGQQIDQCPHILKQIAAAGHTVGNHSYSHPNLTEITSGEVLKQMTETDERIANELGSRPRWMRPPYGAINENVKAQLQELGYEIILWDIDSRDWAGIPGPQIARNILSQLKPGAIILQHCSKSAAGTVEALPYVIEIALGLGYEFTTLDALLGQSPYQD
ncbi:MAG: polysaccharide deacetylase family protein [Alicyclobacillus herbarius]|uniref:polysaccharide deacetylase family protein n=1 Tax=Alicyclobacillus herbarius TaxID=122960 RepID=UPI002355A93E|nr:polysaccharide deacetylase family protein [Alicyclobacillus herbarius]MCL6632433.1 polysaccharide deacetylase family protein [Alicyclobacillus herbarius]